MENFAQNYVKFDIFGTLLLKKGVNPKSLVAALLGALAFRFPATTGATTGRAATRDFGFTPFLNKNVPKMSNFT